ncbi:MAG: Ribosomal RNA small subunit methyltransferase E [Candidatus Marinimicrobia bacterium]|nr:Ribosomal RNA small subunit methyltransferase E [Candidatus Neomarinimicrobiota bacterium]
MPDRTLFYAPIHVTSGDIFQISGAEFNHIIKVLRKSANDTIEVVNGTGDVIHATITEVKKDSVTCRAEEANTLDTELPIQVTLAVGLIKNQRYEWMAEKATELGVTSIQPLQTDRVVRSGFRKDRLEKKIIAAMKQSERAVLPRIFEPVELSEYLTNNPQSHLVYASQNPEYPMLSNYCTQHNFEDITILIGPEGGWSDAEFELFRKHDVLPVHLGRRRLRTETAAIAAISQVAFLYESKQIQAEEMI